uniref:Tyr recombinase domain-containing protein n=1 Tax=uncultured bacterium contig00013 TaxID=1181504 RepID=A0A806K0T0_9BACT|nr:hypothetical protein [uncultured bacterium contig00013]
MNAYPFSVFKRADRSCYSVSFKDANGKYLRPVSTGKKTEKEAIQAAFQMLRDGIPQNKPSAKETAVVSVQDLAFKDMVRKIKTGEEAENILAELRRRGWAKSYVRKNSPGDVDFILFLKEFWSWDVSPYIKEKQRKSHGIHKAHCIRQEQAVTRYWEPFFKGRFLGEITADDISGFIDYMGEKDLSASRRNVVIKAGTKALRWAFSKNKIEIDPTRGHMLFSGDEASREILTPVVAAAAFRAVWKDDRAKIANMLASVTGMRSGEIMALRFQDIGPDCLYVRSSYNSNDKLKTTKNNKSRIVEIPFPDLITGLVELAKQNPWGVGPDSFVFWSTGKKDGPMQGRTFVQDLRLALMQIGITKEDAEKYDFHGWRHFFTSYMVGKLEKKLLKGETGHLTDIMIDRYSDHETVGDRELIQAKKRETFAGLLPERSKLLVFKKESQTVEACG